MEQRPLRLGDILDDYCPRERRVTNHAIVAMIEEDVRQTRCTTCDAEHVYKGGKAPKRRKKDTSETLYNEVLAGMPDLDASPVLAPPPAIHVIDEPAHSSPGTFAAPHDEDERGAPSAPAPAADDEPAIESGPVEEGPVHRRLIRAQLPRIEGHKEARQAPEFTMRQPIGRGPFRGGGAARGRSGGQPGGVNGNSPGNGNTNGNRPHGGGSRFAGPRPGGQGRGPGRPGPGGGFRSGQPRQGGGGRKRSR
jgi:hypothetical protein